MSQYSKALQLFNRIPFDPENKFSSTITNADHEASCDGMSTLGGCSQITRKDSTKMVKSKEPKTVTALKVRQWLGLWDEVQYDASDFQAKPTGKSFFLCSIKASHLKALTGVYRRSTKTGKARALDPNVQRGHEEERSRIIRDFVQYGFPWCEMGAAKRSLPGADDLRKPGWLPTAILVNILPPKAERNGVRIPDEDLIKVEENGSTATLTLPPNFEDEKWQPKQVFPLEVIDGQHRLWAFEDFKPGDDFELPVVAFYGLDRGWQAYLFWSVNITPKKINRSLAFDLYPLLRQQTWLDKFAGHSIYRETRCHGSFVVPPRQPVVSTNKHAW